MLTLSLCKKFSYILVTNLYAGLIYIFVHFGPLTIYRCYKINTNKEKYTKINYGFKVHQFQIYSKTLNYKYFKVHQFQIYSTSLKYK